MGGLERTINGDADVVSLFLGELSELNTERAQVEAGDLLVEVLGRM